MFHIFAQSAWLPRGWAKDVRLSISPQGTILEVVTESRPEAGEKSWPILIPAMPNLHSHAFQRAMAGLAEHMTDPRDSFWTWRTQMYDFAGKIQPEQLQSIAEQLYVEMLLAGYGSVAEFHYLHHRRDGGSYEPDAAMSNALLAAATRVGMGMTLLPTLYKSGGFDQRPLNRVQKRFHHEIDAFLGLLEELKTRIGDNPQQCLGMAIHSLRAVPEQALREVIRQFKVMVPHGPIHIHIAEQTKEVEDCLDHYGQRPVAWLLDHFDIDEQWCLIHATDLTAAETQALARSGAVVGLCPTTEANLGDGLFPLKPFLEAGGRFGIGSDSHISISPIEELRWLEYGHRLQQRKRNITADPRNPHVGARLWQAGLNGGSQAMGRPLGRIAAGFRADLLSLDPASPLLVGRGENHLIDSLIFSGNRPAIDAVLVGGQWQVTGYRHRLEGEVAANYRRTITGLK